MEGMPPGRAVHLVSCDAGWDRAEELRLALTRGGTLVRDHRLKPLPDAAEDDPARLRAELELAEAAVRASEADSGPVLLTDERGALTIPVRMRILLDERKLGWDEAWTLTREATVASFGCPGGEPSRPYCRLSFLEAEQPRLLELVYEINRRHLDDVELRWPGDGGRRRRISLIKEGDGRRLRLGHMALTAAGSASVASPWQGPAAEILADFAALLGPALESRATPVVASRYLQANTALAALLDATLDAAWPHDPAAFEKLETLAYDTGFRTRFREMRASNRARLASFLRERTPGAAPDADALVDVRLGWFAARERPLLSALWLVREHLRLAAGGWTPPAPRTVVLARVAEAAGACDDRLFELLAAVAGAINRDERVRGRLKVAVLPSCDEEAVKLLVAGADLADEPGTAGSSSAGPRALAFAAGGAVLLGTRDGTLRELEQAVGEPNMFLFGLGPLETHAWRDGRLYRPRDVYTIDPLVRLSVDALASSRYEPAPGAFEWVREQLFDRLDPWLVLADVGAYVHRQDEALAEWSDPRIFAEKAILTLARARRFWVERLS
jgi:starch phosphorylase